MKTNPYADEQRPFTPNFEIKIDALWAKANTATGATRRCHFMPQFLMRRWAVDDALRVEDLTTGIVTSRPTKKIRNGKTKNAFIDIGVENDLYTTFDGRKVDRATLEALFGQLESKTSETLDRIAKNDWLLSDQDRVTLSLFVAATALRLPPVLSTVETEYQPDFEKVTPGAKQTPGNTGD